MSRAAARALASLAATAVALALLPVACAFAGAGGEGATWRLEQPAPPPPPPGVQGSSTPVGLGHVGDIEFRAPNRGLLITAGDGSAILPGVWAYDGAGWKELATVCGATDGRIAWAAENEFWTISDGRPGQTPNSGTGQRPPLEDDTLCRFAEGQVAASYASLAFQASSYEAMDATGCIAADDCWFAGAALPAELPVTGSFHLHWNGTALTEEPYEGESQPVLDMRDFQERLYESVRVETAHRTLQEAPVLHAIDPQGKAPMFEGIPGTHGEPGSVGIPLYGPSVHVEALRALHLSADEHALWAATSAVRIQELPEHSLEGQVTVARYAPEEGEGAWRQLLGPTTHPSGKEIFPGDVVESIAAEPGGEGAWIALDSTSDNERPSPGVFATIAHMSPAGTVSEQQTLPSLEERENGIGPKGAAARISCPAAHDCWLVTTQGWLFHLTTGSESPQVDDEGFSKLITNRPPDQGLPQVQPDAQPEEEVATLGEATTKFTVTKAKPSTEASVAVALVSKMHSRLIAGSTLELRFHLAAKARLRLIAKRHGTTVASTAPRTFAAGARKLLLRLDPRRWPTALDLQSHALAPLPTVSSRSQSVETISTGLAFPDTRELLQSGSLF